MPLTRITFTGADDKNDPAELIKISNNYPFVEWGILISSGNPAPRFPSLDWIRELSKQSRDSKVPVNLALHVCGAPLRLLLSAGKLLLPSSAIAFQRIQLNFHGCPVTADEERLLYTALADPFLEQVETIIQLDGVNNHLFDKLSLASLVDSSPLSMREFSGLFDTSHGAGVESEEWPEAPSPEGLKVGYAGGLSFHNVANQVERIKQKCPNRNFWIDMETKLRVVKPDSDIFSLSICQRILDEVTRTNANLTRAIARLRAKHDPKVHG